MSQIVPKIILIDVYETMLDMGDVEKKVNTLLDSKRGYLIWSQLLMQYCFVDNCLDGFRDFLSISKATMQLAGKLVGRTVTDNQASAALELLKHVPLHEEVREELSHLRDMGFHLAALTNASENIVAERMERTGLVSYFEKLLTADMLGTYKPCKEVYLWAANELGSKPEETLMISSHSWDIAGAANAGLQTAYISRDKSSLYSLAPEPDLSAASFSDLTAQLEATVS